MRKTKNSFITFQFEFENNEKKEFDYLMLTDFNYIAKKSKL